jgi:competence protein ComEA
VKFDSSIIVAAVVVLSMVSAVSGNQQKEEDLLPPGPGKEVVVAKCSLCHSLQNIVTVGKETAKFWRETVEEMYYQAGWDEDEDEKIIINYLVTTFGKDERAAADPIEPVPAHATAH